MGRTGSGGAGACARVCRTDPHAGKRSVGASGSRRCSYLHCGGVWKHVELTVAPQAQGTKPARSPGSSFTVVPGEHASRSAPGHGARPSQQAHRLGAGLPPLMGGADRRDRGVGGGRRAQLLCPGRAGSHAPASRCSVQEPRGRRRPGEHAQTANVRGLQPPAPRLLP